MKVRSVSLSVSLFQSFNIVRDISPTQDILPKVWYGHSWSPEDEFFSGPLIFVTKILPTMVKLS